MIKINYIYIVQNRKSYVPQKKTKEELHREAKSLVKNAWKDSGNGGELF